MMRIGAVLPLVVFACVVGACSGESKKDGSATPSPQPVASPSASSARATPAAVSCAVDAEVCTFAREVAGLIESAQYDAVAARTRMFDYACPGDRPGGAGGPFPLCEGATPGERRSGYSVGALQSEGSVETREGLVLRLGRWVTGDGLAATTMPGPRVALVSVGCPLVADATDCSDRFAFVLTRGDGTGLLRFGVQRDGAGNAPRIAQTITGFIGVNPKMVSGGDDDLPVVFGVEEKVGTRYFTVN